MHTEFYNGSVILGRCHYPENPGIDELCVNSPVFVTQFCGMIVTSIFFTLFWGFVVEAFWPILLSLLALSTTNFKCVVDVDVWDLNNSNGEDVDKS